MARKHKGSRSKSRSPKRRYDVSREATYSDEEEAKVSPRGWHAAGKTSDIEKLLKEIDMKKADEWLGTTTTAQFTKRVSVDDAL